MKNQALRAAIVIAVTVSISGCGGGAGDGPANPSASSPVPIGSGVGVPTTPDTLTGNDLDANGVREAVNKALQSRFASEPKQFAYAAPMARRMAALLVGSVPDRATAQALLSARDDATDCARAALRSVTAQEIDLTVWSWTFDTPERRARFFATVRAAGLVVDDRPTSRAELSQC